MIKALFTLMLLVTAGPAFADQAWKVVPNKEVCMVTNTHFAKAQIPVEQNGKTYYGCCQNCKATLQNDASSRQATDPVSQKSVDKARATIAANGEGEVMYFENKQNFDRFMAERATKK